MTDIVDQASGGITRRAVFEPGHVIFREGEARGDCYIIEEGEVDISTSLNGRDVHLATLSKGDIFGEMALVDDGPRSATATTASRVEVFIISRGLLETRMNNLDPLIGLLVRLMIERYRTKRQFPAMMAESELEREALEQAMVAYKRDFYGSTGSFSIEQEQVFQELKMEQKIRQAAKNNEFQPFLQPILSLPEQRVTGFETLIRWFNPKQGMIPPNEFIPVAERTGCVQLLDMLMLRRVCELIPDFLKVFEGYEDTFFISVNLSGIHFENIDVISGVRDIISASGVDPKFIKLEITESALIGDPHMAMEVLEDFKDIGVTTALDDFGTGYSSLGYLHRFAIDSLKIDRAFVSQIHEDHKSLDIVRAIVALAKNFRMGVIAEGIECPDEVNTLSAIGCEMGQGFLFSKPLDIDAAFEYARQNLAEKAA